MPRINVIGLGNVLFGDEGFGVEAVRRLEKQCAVRGDDILFVDGGTQGIYLLDYIESADALLVFDAIIPREYDRQVYVYRNDELPAFIYRKMSSHQMGLSELLSVARLHGRVPSELVLIGIPPDNLDMGSPLSERAEKLMPEALDAGCRQLRAWIDRQRQETAR
ncbi:HyaD/HybD family hydrogenase maturation endopeptidase [Prosthecochloris sp. N3]|uniref:HyaD/HybD family hydrogenase maturation endopeptidase n=1 Tax=Prosthecochloris ethylica TaxID=2743976 RepID=A0ABR9XT19_9CHLB|nr:HyaD/HybD family hydrogenase maturation endopeptidase [Prosthecochloris ethylica]MBF0636983.1 HyaD/HybD family hydrogenase maturation endopeptidase [Prosthecochloris ethylica]NUK47854.1 HyaD/HybD family hydrogenase maturation endopeptidase [Prosthecochloris ethylica]